MDEVIHSRHLLEDRANRLRGAGFVILPDDEPEKGTLGYLFFDGLQQKRIVHYPYGQPLLAYARLVYETTLFKAWLQEHASHPCYRLSTVRLRQVGAVCYCQARYRRAHVIRIRTDMWYVNAPIVAMLSELPMV